MKYNFLPKTKLSGVVATTLSLVVFIIILFFFVAVKRNEKSIQARGFRVLNQYSLNINQRMSNYAKVALNDSTSKAKGSAWLNNLLNKESENNDTIRFIASNDKYKVKCKISGDVLFHNIFNEDLFEDYLVIENNGVIHQTLKNQIDLKNFKSFRNLHFSGGQKQTGLFSNQNDTLVNASRYFKSGFITSINISNINYRLFLSPVYPNTHDKNWYLGGLIKEENYVKAKRAIPTWATILLSLFIVIIIISFPIIKLFLINDIERIHQKNIYFAAASLLFGSALFIILSLNLLTSKYLATHSYNNIHNLSDSIKTNFVNEINTAYDALNWYDSKKEISSEKNCLKDIPNSIYPYFKTIFWMNDEGSQLAEIKTWDKDFNLVNLKYRDYFKSYNEWQMPSDTYSDSLFRLSSIYSNTSGDALVAISTNGNRKKIKTTQKTDVKANKPEIKKAETIRDTIKVTQSKKTKLIEGKEVVEFEETYELGKLRQIKPSQIVSNSHPAKAKKTINPTYDYAKVKAITSQFHSIIGTILPDGFEFRIIDADGLVWFQNNKDKNLQENILVESNYDRMLKATIQNRSSEHFKMSLYGKRYYAYVTPISKLPLYLVTLENVQSNIYQNAQLTLTVCLYLLVILIIGLIFFTVFYQKESKLHSYSYKPLIVGWILPIAKYNKKYRQLFQFNVIQSIVLIILIFMPTLYKLSSSFNVLLFASSLFAINIIFPYFCIKVNGNYKNKIVVFGTVIVLIINAIQLVYNPSYCLYFFLIILITLLGFILLKNKKNSETNSYLKHYKQFMLSWIFIIAIAALSFFYKTLFIDATHLKIKQQQLHIAKAIEKRNLEIDDYYHHNMYSEKQDKALLEKIYKTKEAKKELGIYTRVFYNSTQRISPISDDTSNFSPNKSYWLSSYFHNINWLIDPKNDKIDNLHYNRSANAYWHWDTITNADKSMKFKLQRDIKTKNKNFNFEYKNLIIESDFEKYTPIDFFNFETKRLSNNVYHFVWVCVFILLITLYMWILYHIVKYLLAIITFNDFTENKQLKFDEAIDYLNYKKLNGILINMLDFEEITEQINHSNKYLSIDDLDKNKIEKIDLSDKTLLKIGLSTNYEELQKEIDTIQWIKQKTKHHLIILSPISSSQLVKQLKDDLYEESNIELIKNRKKLIKNIQSVLASYISLYITSNGLDRDFSSVIQSELTISEYMLNFQPILDEYLVENPDASDADIVSKLEKTAITYYQNIWDDCTIEEKFILFDLAHDSICNTKNKAEMESLIGKRLISNYNGLEIMNKSFAGFIINYTNKNRLDNIEMESKRTGGWSKFRVPLIIVMAAIFIFMLTTQQALISNLNAMLLSVGGVVGIVAKYSGIFKGSGA
ncbi:MAG: hypothetical protein JEZ09_16380 [Salinivirgaceae bacterium]|nr:hypothetical protein [Salinivirgaceae bacterium]